MNKVQALLLVQQLLGQAPRAAAPGPIQQRPAPPPPLGAYPAAAPRQRTQPGIQWGGHGFANPQALVAWMNARGQQTSVGQFLGNHPGVAAQYRSRQAQVVAGHPNEVAPRPRRQAYPSGY